MLALRGLEFLKPMETGLTLRNILQELQETQKPHHQDRYFGDDFNVLLEYIAHKEPMNKINT